MDLEKDSISRAYRREMSIKDKKKRANKKKHIEDEDFFYPENKKRPKKSKNRQNLKRGLREGFSEEELDEFSSFEKF